MKILVVGMLGLLLGLLGCYAKTIHYTSTSDTGGTIFSQEWTRHYLFKPDGWPSGLLEDGSIRFDSPKPLEVPRADKNKTA